MELTAYKIPEAMPLPLVPANRKRFWTAAVKGSSLCLPLFIANEWGWWLLNTHTFTVSNDGGDVSVEWEVEPEQQYVGPHFGFGVMSVMVPYIFKVPDGWNIWIRGPVSYFRPGIHPFEGIVEADWHYGSALMNWYVEDGASVTFEAGEPLAHIFPIERRIEEFEPTVQEMPDEFRENYLAWRDNRLSTIQDIRSSGKAKFEGGYRANVEELEVKVKSFAGMG